MTRTWPASRSNTRPGRDPGRLDIAGAEAGQVHLDRSSPARRAGMAGAAVSAGTRLTPPRRSWELPFS
jgi:hypothetical protein